VQGLLQHCN